MQPYQTLLEFSRFVENNAKSYKLNPREATTLVKLCSISTKTANQINRDPFCCAGNKKIGKMLGGVTPGQVTRILNQLQKKGFIRVVRKGNGKRFYKSINGELTPVGSYIDLTPLFGLADSRAEKETEIRRAETDIDSALAAASELRLSVLDTVCEADLNPHSQNSLHEKFVAIKRMRPPRLSREKLQQFMIDAEQFLCDLEDVLDLKLASKMTASGAQNAWHKEQQCLPITQSASYGQFGFVEAGGHSTLDLQMAFPIAFDFMGATRSMDEACNTLASNLRIRPDQLLPFLTGTSDHDDTFLILLYVTQNWPLCPSTYLANLAQKAALDNFNFRHVVAEKIRASKYPLKKYQNNQSLEL